MSDVRATLPRAFPMARRLQIFLIAVSVFVLSAPRELTVNYGLRYNAVLTVLAVLVWVASPVKRRPPTLSLLLALTLVWVVLSYTWSVLPGETVAASVALALAVIAASAVASCALS